VYSSLWRGSVGDRRTMEEGLEIGESESGREGKWINRHRSAHTTVAQNPHADVDPDLKASLVQPPTIIHHAEAPNRLTTEKTRRWTSSIPRMVSRSGCAMIWDKPVRARQSSGLIAYECQIRSGFPS
jgi:hypothetical protein